MKPLPLFAKRNDYTLNQPALLSNKGFEKPVGKALEVISPPQRSVFSQAR